MWVVQWGDLSTVSFGNTREKCIEWVKEEAEKFGTRALPSGIGEHYVSYELWEDDRYICEVVIYEIEMLG